MSGTPRPDPLSWVERHGDVLFRYAMASVRNASVAEDLVQDTFLAGIDALDSFAQRSSERTWLIGILRHKIHDHFRRVSRMRDVAGNGNPDPEKTGADFDEHGRWTHPIQDWHLPEQSLERAQFWKVFDRCVDELPENLRTSFALREIEGLDSDALAATLHTSKNNVWVLLSRARQKLRRCIELLWFAGEGK